MRESFGGAWPAWAVVFLAHLALAVGLEMVLHGRREHISWQVWLGVAALIGGLCAVGYFGFLRYDRSLMMGTPLPVLRAMLIAALETALALIFGGLVAGAQSALTEARFHASRWRKLHRKLRTVPQDADGLWDDEMRDSQQKLGRLTHEGSDAPHLRLQIARHEEYLDDLRASRPGVRFDS